MVADSDIEHDNSGLRKQQTTLFDFGAHRSTMAEVMEVQKKITEQYGIDLEEVKEQKACRNSQKQQRKRDLDHERIKRFWERKKTAKAKARAVLLGYDQGTLDRNLTCWVIMEEEKEW